MGGRSLNVTSGAFGDTLLWTWSGLVGSNKTAGLTGAQTV